MVDAVCVTGHGAHPDQIEVTVTSSAPSAVLNACDAGPEQVFVPESGGWLYNPGSGLCVSQVSGKKHQQAAVSMELCGAAGQQWNLPS